MKIIALEEHLVIPSLLEAWRTGPNEADDHAATANGGPFRARLLDLGAGRLSAMDDQGVDTQVLSIAQPGCKIFTPRRRFPLLAN